MIVNRGTEMRQSSHTGEPHMPNELTQEEKVTLIAKGAWNVIIFLWLVALTVLAVGCGGSLVSPTEPTRPPVTGPSVAGSFSENFAAGLSGRWAVMDYTGNGGTVF